MKIGEKIKKLRTEKLMTQAELAGDSVTRNMLSLIEQGRATPSIQTLNYLASRLNVTSAFLLADDEEEKSITKHSKIADIRLAYKKGTYRICIDLCKKLLINGDSDDEIKLVLAESMLALAKEEMLADRIRETATLLDEALLYSYETVYNTKHIEAECAVIFSYLEEISLTLLPDNVDLDGIDIKALEPLSFDSEICRYIVAIRNVGVSDEYIKNYLENEKNEALVKHITCKLYMNNGEYDKASNALLDILKMDVVLPGVLLYHIFDDLEACSRENGNERHAKNYSDEKVLILERILNA